MRIPDYLLQCDAGHITNLTKKKYLVLAKVPVIIGTKSCQKCHLVGYFVEYSSVAPPLHSQRDEKRRAAKAWLKNNNANLYVLPTHCRSLVAKIETRTFEYFKLLRWNFFIFIRRI